MTALEEFTGPTCPICATNDQVRRERGRYVCFTCWTVFTGEQDEWARARDQREKYAAHRAPVKEPT